MRDVTAKPTRGDLDGAVAAEDIAHVRRAAADPLLGGGQLALGRLGGEGLVLQVEGHDGLGPVLPDAARVGALVVEDGRDALVEGVDGFLLLVEEAGAVGLAVDVVSGKFLLAGLWLSVRVVDPTR